MQKSKKKNSSIIKGYIFLSILLAFLWQSNTAWGINLFRPIKQIKQSLDQRVYLRKINKKIFTQNHIPRTKTQITPLVPKVPSPAFSLARGTPRFKNLPRPKNFDPRTFKSDMKKIRLYAESKLGAKAVSNLIKTTQKTVGRIKKAKGKVVKRKENGRNSKAALSLRGKAQSFRPKKNLFGANGPGRKLENRPRYPISLKKEKGFF